ncbi:Cytochrome P450 monooxygenase cypX [Colletotrichum orbiculare MAFF 240422]|uniref:Cytochrome P450 monooxygenase cypX n=1 Tax=Colletotrichum orbiculare (strain 104-T / ATCC 96160 / CBS 514.97 / LARS 414 / MAFF 240422) TaxID=1213857 RepID=A0A484FJJ2_COLOR|nr:Cytochrome P450 monooxygenase cypX [Colletotrichum orbiculare MAFF 240422]
MSIDPVEELKSSLRDLYHEPEFSDLTIVSSEAEYRVHKAVVCPRSEYFAKKCRDANSKGAIGSHLSLPDDDPHALGVVVRYLYHLDYSSESSSDTPRLNGCTNEDDASSAHGFPNGHSVDDDGLNGSTKSDDHCVDRDVKLSDTADALDDFLPAQPQRLSKKQKKRAKANSNNAKPEGSTGGPTEIRTESPSSVAGQEPAPFGRSQENQSDGGGGAALDARSSKSQSNNLPSADSGKPGSSTVKSLILHANVYALSRKYGIAGLRSLAFDKFQSEAANEWNTEDFLQAAETVYGSCSAEEDDRKMRDMVVSIICQHWEQMDLAENRDVMRAMPKDLMYDILMQVMLLSSSLAIGYGLAAIVAIFCVRVVVTGLGCPIRHLPGPWYTCFFDHVLRYYNLTGRRMHYVHGLHHRYGPIVRISPKEVAVADPESFTAIHKIGSGFLKGPWYSTVTVGVEPGIFAMVDPKRHAARRRLFARAFTCASLRRNWEPIVRQKVERAVERIKAEEAVCGSADILKWWTLMTTDVIAHLSFGESFEMLELGKKNSYVKALESVFIMGTLRAEIPVLYHLAKLLPFEPVKTIMNSQQIVDMYAVKAAANLRRNGHSANLFGNMLAECEAAEKSDLSADQIQAEAGNLIVAGSDTTSVTLTYLVWAVLRRPELRARLENELDEVDASFDDSTLEQLPLLNAVIEETLRLYGAAPGNLPRSVPPHGATLADTPGYSLNPQGSTRLDSSTGDGYHGSKDKSSPHLEQGHEFASGYTWHAWSFASPQQSSFAPVAA